MPLESNPLLIRQHDERVFGPFQVLDEKGTPVNLSVANQNVTWRAFDRPGGTQLFALTGVTASADGGRLLLSTGKASGHVFCSMTSQAISSTAPGIYPTEWMYSIGTSGRRRTVSGPILQVIERLK